MFGSQFKTPGRRHVYFLVINDVIALLEISNVDSSEEDSSLDGNSLNHLNSAFCTKTREEKRNKTKPEEKQTDKQTKQSRMLRISLPTTLNTSLA